MVQDCLALLANLVRHNASNQSLFRETGYVVRLRQLLPGGPPNKKVQPAEEGDWSSPEKDRNIWGLLSILRMFLIKGSMGTQANQNAFQKHGLLQQVLNLAFDDSTALPIKAEVGDARTLACASVSGLTLSRPYTLVLISFEPMLLCKKASLNSKSPRTQPQSVTAMARRSTMGLFRCTSSMLSSI